MEEWGKRRSAIYGGGGGKKGGKSFFLSAEKKREGHNSYSTVKKKGKEKRRMAEKEAGCEGGWGGERKGDIMQSVNIAIADAFSPLFPCCSQGESVSPTEEGDIGRKGRRRDFHNFFSVGGGGEEQRGRKLPSLLLSMYSITSFSFLGSRASTRSLAVPFSLQNCL